MKLQRHWNLCSECSLLIFAEEGIGQHICHEKIRAKRDAELDMVVDEELSTWNQDLKKFWQSDDVRFWELVYGQED